jgi:hypothetical protein
MAKMQTEMIASTHVSNPNRVAGTYQIAYKTTTPNGKTGVVFYHYEYDKRDVMEEQVYASPEIAGEIREFLGDDSPSCFSCFPFPKKGEENPSGIREAEEEASELVYSWE